MAVLRRFLARSLPRFSQSPTKPAPRYNQIKSHCDSFFPCLPCCFTWHGSSFLTAQLPRGRDEPETTGTLPPTPAYLPVPVCLPAVSCQNVQSRRLGRQPRNQSIRITNPVSRMDPRLCCNNATRAKCVSFHKTCRFSVLSCLAFLVSPSLPLPPSLRCAAGDLLMLCCVVLCLSSPLPV